IKSKEPKQHDNKLNVACLARTFYPKNISLGVPKSDVVYDLKAPLVTSEGTYSTMKVVGVESDAEVTCEALHKGNNTTASIILPGMMLRFKCHVILGAASSKIFFLPFENLAGTSKYTDARMEKVNMLFMAVLGLRVLLAKSIAFNTIMSIKLFLF
ncbi:TRDC protein, partial [Stercorarius parasiticus]|nr:TRDC protein [Stercorarius parasiticus]